LPSHCRKPDTHVSAESLAMEIWWYNILTRTVSVPVAISNQKEEECLKGTILHRFQDS
jgi:hypothetical protein